MVVQAMSDKAPVPDRCGYYCIEESIDAGKAHALSRVGHIEKLSITKVPLVTAEMAKLLKVIPSVGQLWLWSEVNRVALRYIVRIPGLRTLDVLGLRRPGSLSGFDRATALEEFRANCRLTEKDVIAVTKCPSLREIAIHYANVTDRVIECLLSMPNLASLDLEATKFDDQMAERLSRSTRLTSLEIGGTLITRRGLTHLISMKQLRVLDLWATDLSEDDLEMLRELPELEYLSLGNYDHLPSLDAARVVPLLLAIPSLKRVWLDGVKINAEQKALLTKRLEYLRV